MADVQQRGRKPKLGPALQAKLSDEKQANGIIVKPGSKKAAVKKRVSFAEDNKPPLPDQTQAETKSGILEFTIDTKGEKVEESQQAGDAGTKPNTNSNTAPATVDPEQEKHERKRCMRVLALLHRAVKKSRAFAMQAAVRQLNSTRKYIQSLEEKQGVSTADGFLPLTVSPTNSETNGEPNDKTEGSTHSGGKILQKQRKRQRKLEEEIACIKKLSLEEIFEELLALYTKRTGDAIDRSKYPKSGTNTATSAESGDTSAEHSAESLTATVAVTEATLEKVRAKVLTAPCVTDQLDQLVEEFRTRRRGKQTNGKRASKPANDTTNPKKRKREQISKGLEGISAMFIDSLKRGDVAAVGGEDEDDENAPPRKKRKNRLGQRARRKLAEQQYGKMARHLQQKNSSTPDTAKPMEKEKGVLKKEKKEGTTAGSATSPTNATTPLQEEKRKKKKKKEDKKEKRDKEKQEQAENSDKNQQDKHSKEQQAEQPTQEDKSKKKAKKEKKDKKSKKEHLPKSTNTATPNEGDTTGLHPSWEAKKRQKELLSKPAVFQGKKIVFTDEADT